MVVVPHLAIGMDDPIEAPADLPEHLQPDLTIPVLEIDRLPPISPGGDVVERAGKLDPQGPRHARTLHPSVAHDKT
jgi:hypothetical protein